MTKEQLDNLLSLMEKDTSLTSYREALNDHTLEWKQDELNFVSKAMYQRTEGLKELV